MIEFKLNDTALRFDFSFFAVITLFFLTGSYGFGISSLILCAAHELSHLAFMRRFGVKADALTFYGAGIRITSAGTERLSHGKQAAVYFSGCAMNFALAAVLWLMGCGSGAAVSLFIGLFNLLPLGELDGARLAGLLVMRRARPENIDKIMWALSLISAAVCVAAALILRSGVSFTLLATALYFIVAGSREL